MELQWETAHWHFPPLSFRTPCYKPGWRQTMCVLLLPMVTHKKKTITPSLCFFPSILSFLHLFLSLCVSLCLSLCLSLPLSVCLSLCLSLPPSIPRVCRILVLTRTLNFCANAQGQSKKWRNMHRHDGTLSETQLIIYPPTSARSLISWMEVLVIVSWRGSLAESSMENRGSGVIASISSEARGLVMVTLPHAWHHTTPHSMERRREWQWGGGRLCIVHLKGSSHFTSTWMFQGFNLPCLFSRGSSSGSHTERCSLK